MKQALRNIFIATAGLTLLAACGGSSDGDGGLTGDIPASEPAAITAQNAPAIAGTVAEVAVGQGIFSSIFTPDIPFAATAAGDAVPPVLEPVLSAAMKKAAPSQLNSMKAGREPCAISGTVDVTVNFSDPEKPSVNDRFEFQFTDCNDGTGVILNGGMTITIASIGGDVASNNFVLGMEIGFFAFAVTEGGETTSAEGTISIVIDTSQPPITTISVSTSAFVTTSDGMEEVLTSFTIEITEDASTAAVTVETSFTISSPRIGGEVTVTTSLALQSMGESYPFVGELRIEGANQAVIVMIALDPNTVRLQIDVDGDSATDETVDMTWDELMAAAG